MPHWPDLATPDRPEILLDAALDLRSAQAVAEGHAALRLSPTALMRVDAGHDRLVHCVESGRLIYGITTGFGPLANRIFSAGECQVLQENLINHLATGLGAPLPWASARAVLLARLCSILVGVSGASPRMVSLLTGVLASPFAPRIPEKGTVGASGDLTLLAHMALSLMGRTPFLDRSGAEVPADAVFRHMGLEPLTLAARDGLALVNGTSAMTGIAVMNAQKARRLLGWSLSLSVGLSELLRGRAEAWHPLLGTLRPHPGQIAAHRNLNAQAEGADRIRKGFASDAMARRSDAHGPAAAPAQDAYTLRCVPQVVGACLDTLAWHDRVVEIELNAATDNPLFPEPQDDDASFPVLHGGNFMGQHVGLASDALASAVVVAAGLAERQIARLTDEKLNCGLPPFLSRGVPGLNSGFMGAQVTATALHAEMRSRAGACSIQSISTNGTNQDVVSMGTIAARRVAEHLEDALRIQAILALCVAQGVDILDERGSGASIGPATRALHGRLRAVAPPFERDRPLSAEIEDVARWLTAVDPPGEAALTRPQRAVC